MFEKMMSVKKYPFIISNTDRSEDGGTHWSLVEYFEHFTKK